MIKFTLILNLVCMLYALQVNAGCKSIDNISKGNDKSQEDFIKEVISRLDEKLISGDGCKIRLPEFNESLKRLIEFRSVCTRQMVSYSIPGGRCKNCLVLMLEELDRALDELNPDSSLAKAIVTILKEREESCALKYIEIFKYAEVKLITNKLQDYLATIARTFGHCEQIYRTNAIDCLDSVNTYPLEQYSQALTNHMIDRVGLEEASLDVVKSEVEAQIFRIELACEDFLESYKSPIEYIVLESRGKPSAKYTGIIREFITVYNQCLLLMKNRKTLVEEISKLVMQENVLGGFNQILNT